MQQNTTVGVVIGRFQTPYLHAGHLSLIATALRENSEVMILLGCQEKLDEKNPYNIKERIKMINRIFPQIDITVLWDVEGNDKEWSNNVDIIVKNYGGTPTLYHSRDSFKDKYFGNIPIKEIPEVEGYSSTKIRNEQKEVSYN